MRIGIIVQALERTPPVRYGAVERVVWYLVEGLVERGHEVTLLASGDSLTSASLIPAVTPAIVHDAGYQGETWWPQLLQISQVIAMQEEFDLVNSHAGYSLLSAEHAMRVPMIHTWHGWTHRPITREILRAYSGAKYLSISKHQRIDTAELRLNWVATVYNGVREEELKYQDCADDYVLFLGRMVPEKRPDWAIRVASSAGRKVIPAGKIFDQDYFEEVIGPLLGPGAEYVGEVTNEERIALLSGASVLIHPSEWEGCSISIFEALGSGTPVLCVRRCSNPELVDHGVTGYVCDTFDEMTTACELIEGISRKACRDRFLDRYTADRMIEGYLSAYDVVLSQHARERSRADPSP